MDLALNNLQRLICLKPKQTNIQTYTHTYTHVFIYIYIYTHTHTHTHTQCLAPLGCSHTTCDGAAVYRQVGFELKVFHLLDGFCYQN